MSCGLPLPSSRGLVTFVIAGLTATAIMPAPVAGNESDGSAEVEKLREVEAGQAPLLSNDELRVQHFTIPAPRGLIVDRNGDPLAANRVVTRLAIRLSALDLDSEGKSASDGGDIDAVVAAVGKFLSDMELDHPDLGLVDLSERDIRQHWQHRRHIPLPISSVYGNDDDLSKVQLGKFPALTLQTEYARYYPEGEVASHLTGYVQSTKPDQHGPLTEAELRWPEVIGRAGLEVSLDGKLAGTPGKLSEMYDENGLMVSREIFEKPKPGTTVVTTIDLAMQQEAQRALAASGRAGAFVVMDSRSGDLLVLASHPTFDPMEFVSGISAARYSEIANHPGNPFFFRPVSGAYPPGSTFKPFVALAALDRRVVNGLATLVPAPAKLNIDGRDFHNWHDRHEGNLDVRYALLRSSNTWFYQVGIQTGGPTIFSTAETFGFGAAPDLPFENVAAGKLPMRSGLGVSQAIANFSIGQGELEVSPVQLAAAVAGLADGRRVPKPRLLLQHQDSLSSKVIFDQSKGHHSLLNYREYDLKLAAAGMWGVVNHEQGTGKAAAVTVDSTDVYGKTGTAQWYAGGDERALAWFCGFLPMSEGALSFVVFVEGEKGEKIYGGQNAAPIAGQFLRTITENPAKFGVSLPEREIFTAKPISTPVATPVAISATDEHRQEQAAGGYGAQQPQGAAITAEPVSAPVKTVVNGRKQIRIPVMSARQSLADEATRSPAAVDAPSNTRPTTQPALPANSVLEINPSDVPDGVSLPEGALQLRPIRAGTGSLNR